MAYIADLTDKGQDEREEAAFEGGIPVFAIDGTTKIIAKGANGSPERAVAGVIMSHDDAFSRFESDLQGRT